MGNEVEFFRFYATFGQYAHLSNGLVAAMPIVSKLAKLYPDIDIEYHWADEDIGVNVGRSNFSGGELVQEYLPELQSKEAYELAAKIMGVELSDYDLVFDEKS